MIANFRAQGDGRDGRGEGWVREQGPRETEITIVLEESQRSTPVAFSARWKRPTARVVAFSDPLAELVPLVASSAAQGAIFASLSSVCVLDTPALLALAAGAEGRIIKLSVERTPIEMYASSRETMLKLLRSLLDRRTDRRPLRECLFTDGLLPSIDLIEEVPGAVLFQNDLMQFYRQNLWLLDNCASERFLKIIARLPELSDRGVESRIAEKGYARNSWLGSGVEVEGQVESSILFPNVHIKKNTLVSHSIVMNGNRIGSGGEIHTTLVLPFSAELPRAAPNIGDNCSIGSKSSVMKNSDFPEQIRDGLTVVGMDAEIPAGLRIEPGACIGPGVPASLLRKMKLVKKGSSVFKPHSDEPEAREENGRGRR